MFDGLRRILIRVMIQVFRFNRVSNYALPFRLERYLFYLHGVVNSVVAAGGGFLLTYVLQGDALLSVKVASCLTAVGYHLRLTPVRDYSQLIRTILTNEDET